MGGEESGASSAGGHDFREEISSCCSTPYVSAPSSPGREGAPFTGFYYSAPASPTHFFISASTRAIAYPAAAVTAADDSSFEFDFFAKFPASEGSASGSMTSADELFSNGQIRPMRLSTHLQRPQTLEPLVESDDFGEEEQTFSRTREMKLRAGSLRRRTRSMSPNRSTDTESLVGEHDVVSQKHHEEQSNIAEIDGAKEKAQPSRLSSGGRSSGRWIFLKDFLYRSKSEGRNEGHKFWGSLSFSPVKDKDKKPAARDHSHSHPINNDGKKKAAAPSAGNKNTAGKRRIPPASPHELHYAAKRAQAEEMKRRTFLPYRQGLFGCLGFTSRSYGAMNGFARSLKIRS